MPEFQSTLPCGSDLCSRCLVYRGADFNPRSLAGATEAKEWQRNTRRISIHAPLRERHAACITSAGVRHDFNPRSLAGATQPTNRHDSDDYISIHAPLRERPWVISGKVLIR